MNRTWLAGAWEDLVTASRPTAFQSAFRLILSVLGATYGGLMILRNFAYASGIFPSKKTGLPVIAVGNLSLGGTGKTSLVLWCAAVIGQGGKKAAILSRGYLRRAEDSRSQVVSDGRKILAGAESSGDEPLLLAKSSPGMPVIVGSSRVRSAMLAIREFGPHGLLLDDAFQHRRIARDLDLVCLDENIFRAPRVFPSGFLREPPSGLGRASALVVQTERSSEDYLRSLERVFSFRWKGPAFFYRYAASQVVDHRSQKVYEPSWLRGQALYSVSAIARPENFERMVSAEGGMLVGARRFADHHFFEPHELLAVRREAEKLNARVIVTAKDAVKLASDFPALVLNIKMQWTQGEEELKKMILDVIG